MHSVFIKDKMLSQTCKCGEKRQRLTLRWLLPDFGQLGARLQRARTSPASCRCPPACRKRPSTYVCTFLWHCTGSRRGAASETSETTASTSPSVTPPGLACASREPPDVPDAAASRAAYLTATRTTYIRLATARLVGKVF